MNNFQDSCQSFDIAIVGAGMVGSALACGLADAGYQVVIYDHQSLPEFSPDQPPAIRVSALSLTSEQLLDRLGAWTHMKSMRMCPYRRLAVWEAPYQPMSGTSFDCGDVDVDHLGAIVENNVTQIALHQAMASRKNITLRCPSRIASHQLNPDTVSLTATDGKTDDAKLVIGADGALSKTRNWAQIGLTSDQYRQQAMVITVEYAGKQEDITWQEFHPSGPTAFLPLPDVNGKHYASLVWYHSPEHIAHLKEMSSVRLLEEIQRNFPAPLPKLIAVIETGHFPLIKRHAQHYYNDRFVLAGDAAHTINPLAGQGVNLGFQDVEALIDLLSEAKTKGLDPATHSILRAYEQRRRPHNTQMMLIMDVFYHTFSNQIPPLKWLRNIGLRVADRALAPKREVLKFALGIKPAPEWMNRLGSSLFTH